MASRQLRIRQGHLGSGLAGRRCHKFSYKTAFGLTRGTGGVSRAVISLRRAGKGERANSEGDVTSCLDASAVTEVTSLGDPGAEVTRNFSLTSIPPSPCACEQYAAVKATPYQRPLEPPKPQPLLLPHPEPEPQSEMQHRSLSPSPRRLRCKGVTHVLDPVTGSWAF